jgi:hypothetical protein
MIASMTNLRRGLFLIVVGFASTAGLLAQELLPGALAVVKDPIERRAIETALSARNLLDGNRLCGVGRIPVGSEAKTLFVVSIEENGRYCNTVAVVRGGPEPEAIQTFQATGGANILDDLLRDLDNDGVPELVFRRYVASFSSECVVVVPVVYKCTANGCSDQSPLFADFFVKELDNLHNRIAVLTRTSGADSSCLVIERDKILRQLGSDKLAGLPIARRWAQSDDPIARQKAAFVAGDIDDPAAANLLDQLLADQNKTVANQAEQGIRKRQRRN